MAGPTPVSALIHAATMVTAGVYMVCRLSFIYSLAPGALATVAWVGGLTAIFAAKPGCRWFNSAPRDHKVFYELKIYFKNNKKID